MAKEIKKIKVSKAHGMTAEEKTQHNKELLLSCLKDTLGIVNSACIKAGIARETYYRWYRADKEFRRRADDITETQIDVAEASLLRKIKDGDTTSIIFYLKTRGKDRGYMEKQIVEAEVNTTIKNPEQVLKNLSEKQRESLLKLAEELDQDDE
ncbi:phBC6A51 family helix-turn-helix protein [Riemerella anatipestifer]|uniref:phBC6A51 family helix-turn-helix protein n=1 Tax=Riemerella anatipestifer TaxID=34085 RepID=UPI0012B1C354|nr:phBC6A51 family helix-turn-helix protein [Riemerella anatipestifer]MSN81961.1 hypothetical protein [Riemerella anatipestifer]NAV16680.1 hypothetical protein [Riemerella anatipestifer]UXN81008.1 hypothetical protein [Phage vB_RanS_PJN03]